MKVRRYLNARINRQVSAEDKALSGRVQQGLQSQGFANGPLSRYEYCIEDFHRRVQGACPVRPVEVGLHGRLPVPYGVQRHPDGLVIAGVVVCGKVDVVVPEQVVGNHGWIRRNDRDDIAESEGFRAVEAKFRGEPPHAFAQCVVHGGGRVEFQDTCVVR